MIKHVHRPHVMIVDDEQMLLKLTKRGLERMGYKISAFSSSKEALAEFNRGPQIFDLIITDKSMPHLNGLDFLREIRTICKQIPLIMFTGFIDEHQENELRSSINGIKIILKPIRMKELSCHIEESLDPGCDE